MGNANLHFPPTPGQVKGMMIAREIFATPSLIGSIYMMQDVLRSPGRRRNTGPRILFGMSSMDLLFAIFSLANSWPAPKGTPWTPAAIGTWRSCETFGFIGHATKTSSVLYNGSLALYYLLTIRYSWKDWQMKRLEPWLHAVPLLFGWVTGLVALQLELLNPMPVGCTIQSYPMNCGAEGSGKRPCERGENSYHYQIAFFYAPLVICFIFLVWAMAIIYRKMAKLHLANDLHRPERSILSSDGGACIDCGGDCLGRIQAISTSRASVLPTLQVLHRCDVCLSNGHRGRNCNNNTLRQSKENNRISSRNGDSVKRQFAIQAILYCSAYAIVWLFAMIRVVVEFTSPTTGTIPLAFLHVTLGSLQGFFNASI